MAETVIRGTKIPQAQRIIYDSDPTRGFSVSKEFDGAGQEEMLLLQQDYIRAGIACRLTFERDKARLETQDSTQQYTLDTWQLLGNTESRDALSHPTVLQLATDDQIAALRKGIENPFGTTVPSITDKILSGSAFDGVSDVAKETLSRFLSLAFRGSTEYRRGQYVLRHETNAPSRWESNIADFGVDQIYSQAALLSEAQSSSLWILPLPSRLAYKIANFVAPESKDNYFWGWLKGASTETLAANNRITIATEYVLEQWSTDYYSIY